MVSKLKEIGAKNPILNVFVELFCRCIFRVVSIWKECMSFLRIIGIGGKTYSSLKKYKSKYYGQRCFIIAMGPSLRMGDLEKLKNEVTFGMNSICKIYDKTKFRPTYYGIQDFYVYEDVKDYIEKYYSGKNNVFISDRVKMHFKIDDNWNVFPLNMAYNAYKRWFKEQFEVKVSDDIYKTVYDGFSITMSLLQIAMYMGFKKIYLIGADCNFKLENLHFVEHNNSIDTTLNTAAERNFAGYRAIKDYANKNGIKIYNATRGGMLEIFERVDLDNIFVKLNGEGNE